VIQQGSDKVYEQATCDWKREFDIQLCEIKALLKDGTRMPQRGALGPTEVPMLGGVLLLVLAPLPSYRSGVPS